MVLIIGGGLYKYVLVLVSVNGIFFIWLVIKFNFLCVLFGLMMIVV